MPQKLGQHFLTNSKTLQKIAAALGIHSGETVIEIGPGHGELTEELIKAGKELRIVAIERDKKLVRFLKEKYKRNKNIEIIEGDALKMLPELSNKLPTNLYKITGNIPYYITGHLLRVVGELGSKPKLSVLLIQKEVAERAVSKPPKMNLLAASLQIWAHPEIIERVPSKYFNPSPEVDSAVIKLTTNSSQQAANQLRSYYKMLRILFKQPRKTILNNLKDGVSLSKAEISKKLEDIKIRPLDRPQNLDVKDINNVAEIFLQ